MPFAQSAKVTKNHFFRSSFFILCFGTALVGGLAFILLFNLDRDGIPPSYVAGVVTGLILLLPINAYFITAFLQKRDSEKIVAAVQAQHDRALASSPDGIFEWDLRNNTRYWSPRLKEMIGFMDHEIEPAPDNTEDRIHPDDLAMRNKAIEDHLNGLTPEFSVVFRWLHKQGHWVWVKARGKAVFDDHGQPIFLTGSCMDITELKEYEEKLEQARLTAENESRAKSEFLAHMSHELRTPLTAITGTAEILMMKRKSFDPKVAQLIGALDTSAQALRDLLGGILDFSKIESGELKLEKKPFYVADVLDDVAEIILPRADDKDVKLIMDSGATSGFTMIGDRIRFKQIVMNLVGNAVKFTEKGNVTVTTRMHEHEGRHYFQVSVSDTGIGIRPENIETIFERFVQADSSVSRKYGGTGLGLPIAQQLAQLMGGKISVQSVFGEGSVFTACFPVEEGQLVPGVVIENANAIEARVPQHRNPVPLKLPRDKKVLIVEDYEGTITVISQMIDDMGYSYDIARTGLEALNKWNAQPYSLVLMDIQMPEMDGMTALTQIRNIEHERGLYRTPVIAMTAHAFQEDQSKCLEAGFDGYLAKPVSSEDLISKINLSLRNVAEKEQSI
jgi:PAS domain S-box-containing protein